MILLPIFIQQYTKKEDVRDVPRNQRKGSALVLIMTALLMGIIQLTVFPKLHSMYVNFGLDLPLISRFSVYVTVLILIISFIGAYKLLKSEPDFTKVNRIAKNYKSGEMIKTRELIESKYQLVMLPLILGITYIVVAIIIPIYSLTKQY
jgi:type II secretory pathway component PulF